MKPILETIQQLLAIIGALSLLVLVITVLLLRTKSLGDLLLAWLLGVVEPVHKGFTGMRLKADIQGHMNGWIGQLNKRLPMGLSVPRISVKLHDAESSRRVLQDGGLLILLDAQAKPEENYSRATKWVVGAAALSHAYRPYIRPQISEAFELTVARMMLRDRNPAALASFNEHSYGPALDDPKVAHYCYRFETIDDAGFFTRVLWPELEDFGRRHVGRHPTRRSRDESSAFVHWLHEMAARPKGDTRTPLRFQSASMNAAFALIRDQSKGLPAEVYRRYISEDLNMGFPRIYVCGRVSSIPYVKALARSFRSDPRVKEVKIYEYDQALFAQSVLDEALQGQISLPRQGRPERYVEESEEQEAHETTEAPITRVRAVCAIIYNAAAVPPVGLTEEAEAVAK